MVKQILKEKHLTVAWLADKVHKAPSNLRKTLKKKSMDTDLLCRISDVLNHCFLDCYKE